MHIALGGQDRAIQWVHIHTICATDLRLCCVGYFFIVKEKYDRNINTWAHDCSFAFNFVLIFLDLF